MISRNPVNHIIIGFLEINLIRSLKIINNKVPMIKFLKKYP